MIVTENSHHFTVFSIMENSYINCELHFGKVYDYSKLKFSTNLYGIKKIMTLIIKQRKDIMVYQMQHVNFSKCYGNDKPPIFA